MPSHNQVKRQIAAYGLGLSFSGDTVRVTGPGKGGGSAEYFSGPTEHLGVFWKEFRRIVDPQLSSAARS